LAAISNKNNLLYNAVVFVLTVEDCRGGVAPLYPSPPSPTPAQFNTSSDINHAFEMTPSSPLPPPRSSVIGHAFLSDSKPGDELKSWPDEPVSSGITVLPPPPPPPTAFFPLSPAFFHPAVLLDLQRYGSGGLCESVAMDASVLPHQSVQPPQPCADAEMDTLDITAKVCRIENQWILCRIAPLLVRYDTIRYEMLF